MRKKHYFFIAFFVLLSHGVQILYGQNSSIEKVLPDIPSRPRLVNDLGDMLNEDEELRLENKLFQYEQKTSNEIAIVTIDSLYGHVVEDYAVALGRKWDIGKASKKNGVLILASRADRKINISPAYGLSGVLPDVICARIIREHIVPHFKAKNFYQGFDEATDIMFSYIANEFTADPAEAESPLVGFIVLLFILVVFMIIIFGFFYAIRNRKSTYVSRRGWINKDDDWTGGSWGGGGFGGGSWGGGSWGGGSSGGGGFGGFGGGGGGFDGGGASGSW